MDRVASHNLGNQIYRYRDISTYKVEALSEILHDINPDLDLRIHKEITPESVISGNIFLCIDNIDLRRSLVEVWLKNPHIKFITDTRMRLTDGQVYSADWSSAVARNALLASMQFTHAEAAESTPVSACGTTLSVIYTPVAISAFAVANFIEFVNVNQYSKFEQVDFSNHLVDFL